MAPQRITGAPILVENRCRDTMYKLQEPVKLIRPLALVGIVDLAMEVLTKALEMAIIVIESLPGDELLTTFSFEEDRRTLSC